MFSACGWLSPIHVSPMRTMSIVTYTYRSYSVCEWLLVADDDRFVRVNVSLFAWGLSTLNVSCKSTIILFCVNFFLRFRTFQMTDGSSDELLYSRYSVREGQPEVVYSSSNSVRLAVEIETYAVMYLVLSYSQADGRLSNTLSPHLSHLRPLH